MAEKQFDATINLEDVIDDPDALTRAFDAAAQKSEERLWGDPEWTEQRWTHRKDIIRAFLVGVVNADGWFTGYTLPPNLETVANALCAAQVLKFKGDDESVNVSLLDIEAFFREFINETPLCKEWNEFPGSGFVTRYDATPKQRTFIDLDALIRNAAIHIRTDRRDFDRFNAEFDAKQASEANPNV